MTQDKRTPGPWFVTPDGFCVTDKPVLFDQDGSRHGETPNIVIFAETQANARLIAAAPDLLEALLLTQRTGMSGAQQLEAMQAAQAAIAKATGQ